MTLKIHPAVEIVRLDETKWQIIGASQRHTISAPAGFMEAVVHACSGRSTRQDITHSLGRDYDPDKVAEFLAFLIKKNYLLAGKTALSDESLIQILDLQSRSLSAIANNGRDSRSLPDCTVGIIGTGMIAEKVCEQLDEIGCRFGSSPDALANSVCDIALVCSDRVDHDFFRNVNRETVATQLATLFVALDGSRIILGPFTDPPATACFECFHTRLRSNTRHLSELDARVGGEENAIIKLPASRLLARWSASIAVAKLAAHATGVRLDHPGGGFLK